MKRILYVLFMSLFMIFVSGCGSQNEQATIMKDYSFGYQAFGAGNSRITLLMPFEIAQTRGLPWMQQVGKPSANQGVTFQGSDQKISLIIMGDLPEGKKPFVSLDTMADNAILNLKQSPAIKNLKSSVTSLKIGKDDARKIQMEYTQNNLHLGMVQYLFIDRGILWNIIYLYQTNDPEGVALVKYVEGKIQINQ